MEPNKYMDYNALLYFLQKLKNMLADYAKKDDLPDGLDVDVPTKVSELENDAGYITEEGAASLIEGYGYQDAQQVLAAIEAALEDADVGFLKYKGAVGTFTDLPTGFTDDNNGWMYGVTDTGEEYYWIGGKWNHLDFTVDLSGYWAKDELVPMTNADINAALTAAGL